MKLKNMFALTGTVGIAFMLGACAEQLTPKEMAKQTKACRANGLVPEEVHQGYSPMPVAIAYHLPKPKAACD